MLFARYVQEFYKDSPNLDVYQFAAHQSAYEMLTNVIRESYRALSPELTGSYDIVIVAKNRAAGRGCDQIKKDLAYIFRSLELL